MIPSDDELAALLARFGHDRFRPGQRRVIRALLGGRDVLALLPTGAGKSLGYQLASQLLPGATVVVTPLLALMKDQADSIAGRGFAAALLQGSLSQRRLDEQLGSIEAGAAKLLYLTPERLADPEFLARLGRLPISLIVIDEAHCISEWGHSFRPSYLGLGDAIARLGRPTTLALTATATPWVREEIVARLGLRDPLLVVRGVDRPNLFFEVRRVEDERDDRRTLQRLLMEECDEYPEPICAELGELMRGSGIIYTATTAGAKETAGWLREWGIAADYYHGRRTRPERERVQEAFMAGELRVIAATNAFGLGVDKPDLRFVIHRDVPASLEAYYQEAGRAGRDGDPARCTLIYRPGDLSRASFLGGGGRLTREEVQRAYPALLANPRASLSQLEAASGLGRADLERLAVALVHDGLAELRRGRLRLLVDSFDPDQVSLDEEERRGAYERSRVEMMRGYAEGQGCRRAALLSYFGEEPRAERCGHCDSDQPRNGAERIAVTAKGKVSVDVETLPFAAGSRVEHREWGPGDVRRIEGDALTVLFERVGYKTLSAALVLAQGLLWPA